MPPKLDELLDKEFMMKIERLTLVTKKIFLGKMKGERRSRKRGISTDFADYRNYVPGDDIRFIDWNIYGRLERLFLKLFLEEEDLHIYILIDTSESMKYGEPSKLFFAQRTAAALAYIGLIGLDRVGIGLFDSTLRAVFPPIRGRKQLWRMLDFIRLAQTEGGETDLAESVKAFTTRYPAKGIAVLVSDFFDRSGHETALRYLLARDLDIYAIQILAPDEIKPDVAGDLQLVDCEDGDIADVTVSAPLMKRYKESLNFFIGGIKQYCTQRGINHIFASTEMPFDQLILTFLRKRGLLK
ncbi:MAG: DUF58 domain-containing protein [Planctomycetota bacterium]|nr:MAG: DUF58 domain-containing protein [Planctomycetota bacterium]